MQFMPDRKTFILVMAPKRPDTMADMVIVKCVTVCAKQVAECHFPFLVLFGAHILSFYE